MTRRLGVMAIAAVILVGSAGLIVTRRRRGPVRTHGKRPNVVLIEICSLRYDRLGCNGYGRPTTPMIDALAKSGVRFEHCISQSSWTKPSTASILTGLSPNVHNLTDSYSVSEITADGFMPKRALSPDAVTIAEALERAGYQTAGFVANVNAWPAFGVSQGFDHYDYAHPRSGHALTHRFGEWLRGREQKRPFFAFMLFFDVHHAYDPPYAFYQAFSRDAEKASVFTYPSHRAATNYPFLYSLESRPDWSEIKAGQYEQWVDLYDGAVRTVDDAVRRVVEHLVEERVGDDTAIIVVADHGDSLTEHDRSSHGNSLYQELVHVPLVMYLPGVRRGQVVDRLVRSIDIYPTLCDYCGAQIDPSVQGRSLLPLLRHKRGTRGVPLALSSMGRGRDAIQDSRWKYIRYGKSELFDLEHDPGETRDVSAEYPEEAKLLQTKLAQAVHSDEVLRRKQRASSSKLGAEAVEQLKSLGYVK